MQLTLKQSATSSAVPRVNNRLETTSSQSPTPPGSPSVLNVSVNCIFTHPCMVNFTLRPTQFYLYFYSCFQTSGSRRSSFSNPPQPLLNAVRSKQENFATAFPVTWAQRVAFSTPSTPLKSLQKSPSRFVPSAGASPVRGPTNSCPWSASNSSQSYRGNYVLFPPLLAIK